MRCLISPATSSCIRCCAPARSSTCARRCRGDNQRGASAAHLLLGCRVPHKGCRPAASRRASNSGAAHPPACPPVLHPPLLHSSQAGPAATGSLPLAHSAHARAACYMLHAHAAREARLDGRETRSSVGARTRCWVSPNRRDCSASWFLAPCGTAPAARGLSCARARAMRGAAPTLRAFSRSFMWLACSSARAAGSSFAMLDRSAASAPLCGGARRRRDAIQRICGF